MLIEHGHNLIIAIVNSGYSDRVMEVAREAGAGGGTLLHGRGTGANYETLFGVKIEPEKEVVMILAEKRNTVEIVESIYKNAGLNTPGIGIVFALPVDMAAMRKQ